MPQIRRPTAALGANVRVFRPPLVGPEVPVREQPFVSFADLVRMMAEGISEAQATLDRSSAELLTELADAKVKVVPRVIETVAEDGSVTYEHAEPVEVSLLDLGVTPTFYQFSQSTVEVEMDLKVVETVEESSEGRRRFGLFAGTTDVRARRKLNRESTAHAKLTTTLVPVPMPVRLEPTRTTVTPEP
jgi:hypothetical protein